MRDNGASISDEGGGRLALHGDLNFASVVQLWPRWQELAAGHPTLEVDLGAVQRADSAGLALLVAGLRLARQTGQSVRFLRLPAQLQAIAEVSGLGGMLSPAPAAD